MRRTIIKDFITKDLFGIPKKNRLFTLRFLLVTYSAIFILFLWLFLPFRGIPLSATDTAVNLYLAILILFGIRYIVQAVRMRKALDAVGVGIIILGIMLFYLTIYVLSYAA